MKHKLLPNSSNNNGGPSVPYKMSRLNSSPATSTITSNYLNNDQAAQSITNTNHQFLTPPIQISYCLDSTKVSSTNSNSQSKSTTITSHQNASSTIVLPATIDPLIKIDYSNLNLSLPMTSTTTASSSPAAPIQLDFSTFNPSPAQFQQKPTQEDTELDENYDD